jgi:hypothetical protein
MRAVVRAARPSYITCRFDSTFYLSTFYTKKLIALRQQRDSTNKSHVKYLNTIAKSFILLIKVCIFLFDFIIVYLTFFKFISRRK